MSNIFHSLWTSLVLCLAFNVATSMALVNIKAEAMLYWQLVFDYDNSANSGTIEQLYELKTSKSYTARTFDEMVAKTVQTSRESNIETGAYYGPMSAKLMSHCESSVEINDTLEKVVRTATESTITESHTFKRIYTVGPHGKLVLYQQHFSAPGIHVACDVFKAVPSQLPEEQLVRPITISISAKPMEFIKAVQVIYTDSPGDVPIDHVREIQGGNTDINYGFGGKYVNLRPVYTTQVKEAATHFDFISQGNALGGHDDLAKGAGGSFRYLIPVPNEREHMKITEIWLYRSGTYVGLDQVIGAGWQGMSADMNKDRNGDWLHLLWKTRAAYYD